MYGIPKSLEHRRNYDSLHKAPYVRVLRESLGLSENHPALGVFDVFAAH